MRAIQHQADGGYEENRLVDLPRPQLAEGEVLLEMRSVGINPLDNTSAPAISMPLRRRTCRV